MKQTENWCHPKDELTDEGCEFWFDQPPSLEACRACILPLFFCNGCLRYPICEIHPYPKTWPSVSRFLQKFNLADALHQPVWADRWENIPYKEWQMIQVAQRTLINSRRKERPKIGM